MILSLLKYSNENTKRGAKSRQPGILYPEEAFAMKCNATMLAKECKKVREGISDLTKAAKRCGYSTKQFRRKYKGFLSKGEESFVHGNRGMGSKRRIPDDIREAVVREYFGLYPSFNFTHFYEKIGNKFNVSKSAVYRILTDAGFKSPMCQRKKRKKERAHPSRPRRTTFGQLIQVDATFYDFFEDGKVYALHAAIDDATGNFVGMWMDSEETLYGYYRVLRQMLLKYGICDQWYTDRRTVFVYQRKDSEATDGSEDGVQFAKWCSELGIELIETSVSQAKGRIERSWRTFKGRWKNELPIMGIATMEQFNERVQEVMEMHNRRFGMNPSEIENDFVPLEMSEAELDRMLTRREKRVADRGSCFSIKRKRVQLIKDDGNVLVVEPKTIVEIRTTWTGETFGYYNHEYYRIKEIGPKPAVVSTFSKQSEKSPVPIARKQHKPSLDHPWRCMKI